MTPGATTRGAEGLDRRAFSVDDVLRMLEAGILGWDEKFELIRGEIVPMASELAPHAQMKAFISRELSSILARDIMVGNDITVSLGDIGLFEADVLVWRAVKGRTFIPIAQALFAVEVAYTTLREDLALKAPDYARAGLAELWVVDLQARVTHVFRDPQAGAYAVHEQQGFEAALTIACAPGAALRLADLDSY